jgi:beta-glucosidase
MYYNRAIDYYGDSLPEHLPYILSEASKSDVIVYVGGISPRIEGEEMDVVVPGFYRGDRTSILLPELQTRLLKELKKLGKPVVVVLLTGSAIALPWESENADAIVNAWYGGEFAGKAIADVLFGNYNPSGHLPVTFYASDSDLPDFEDYSMESRTYKYFKGKALYPFGYGLSYTTFGYKWLSKPLKTLKATDVIRCKASVTNSGKTAGDNVAQVYIKYPGGKGKLPLKELRYFERNSLQPQKSKTVSIAIPVKDLAKWDDASGALKVVEGEYTLFVGSNSEDEAITATFTVK